jgi:hypothetical protein
MCPTTHPANGSDDLRPVNRGTIVWDNSIGKPSSVADNKIFYTSITAEYCLKKMVSGSVFKSKTKLLI